MREGMWGQLKMSRTFRALQLQRLEARRLWYAAARSPHALTQLLDKQVLACFTEAMASKRLPTAERRPQIAEAALRIISTMGVRRLTSAALAQEVGIADGAERFENAFWCEGHRVA